MYDEIASKEDIRLIDWTRSATSLEKATSWQSSAGKSGHEEAARSRISIDRRMRLRYPVSQISEVSILFCLS
jgi:hypothetical protein